MDERLITLENQQRLSNEFACRWDIRLENLQKHWIVLDGGEMNEKELESCGQTP